MLISIYKVVLFYNMFFVFIFLKIKILFFSWWRKYKENMKNSFEINEIGL